MIYVQGRTLLVVCDYFSNYIEVERVTKVNTTNVTKALKSMFARYGPPDALVSDNGRQFSSEEFAVFAKSGNLLTSRHHHGIHNQMEKQKKQ